MGAIGKPIREIHVEPISIPVPGQKETPASVPAQTPTQVPVPVPA